MSKRIILSFIITITYLCYGFSQESKAGKELIFNSHIGFGTLEIQNSNSLRIIGDLS